LVLPVAVLLAYFVVPVNEKEAPVGVLAGILLSVVAVAVVGVIIFREASRVERRFRPIHLILALEVVLVIFSFTYFVIAVNDPDQIVDLHTRLDSLYFSASTVATVGFGDVHASGQLARGLVTLQIVFNLGFVAALANLLRDQIAIIRPRHGKPGEPEHTHED
jgi:hypothetical protein